MITELQKIQNKMHIMSRSRGLTRVVLDYLGISVVERADEDRGQGCYPPFHLLFTGRLTKRVRIHYRKGKNPLQKGLESITERVRIHYRKGKNPLQKGLESITERVRIHYRKG